MIMWFLFFSWIIKHIFTLFFFFWLSNHTLQDFSSPTRDWIQAMAVKAQNPDHTTPGNSPLHFVHVVYHTDWFADTEKSLHLLIMLYDPFNVFCIQLASILLRIFVSMFISDIGCNLFSVVSLVFMSEWWQPHRMSLEVFLLKSLRSFRRIGVKSSLNVWYNSCVKPSDPGFLFVKVFFSLIAVYWSMVWY